MKKIVSVFILVCMLFSFVGCNANEIILKIFPTPAPTPCLHGETVWEISIYPSKMAEGKEYEKCLLCGDKIQTRAIEKLPCEHKETYLEKVKTPTDTEEGLNKIVCYSCKNELGTEPIYTKAQIKEKLLKSVFKVYAYDYSHKDYYTESQGSGFFIDKSGTFITNAHVIEGCSEIKVLIDGKKYDVEAPLYYDKVNSDIAFLRIKGGYESVPVEFSQECKLADGIFALGFPNDAPELLITKGNLVNEAYIVDGVAYYLFNAEVDHGSSGGILCDRLARVIGVVTLGWDDGINGALKFKFLEHLVENLKVK